VLDVDNQDYIDTDNGILTNSRGTAIISPT